MVTTLLDPQQSTKEDLTTLYHAWWNNELDFRYIMWTMQLRDLRCKMPELVPKEICSHVLAYKLLRTIIAHAAVRNNLLHGSISFNSASQMVEAFQPLIEFRAAHDAGHRLQLYQYLHDAVAAHRVAVRHNRYEPRVRKHRRNHCGLLTKPRRDQTQFSEKCCENLMPFVTSTDASRQRCRTTKPEIVGAC